MADYTTFNNGEPSDRAAGGILMSIPGAGTQVAYYDAANRGLAHDDAIRIGKLYAGTCLVSAVVRSKVEAAGELFQIELRNPEGGAAVPLEWATDIGGAATQTLNPNTLGLVGFQAGAGGGVTPTAMEIWLVAKPGAGKEISSAKIEVEFGIFAHLTE